MSKFRESVDGVERCTVMIPHRLSREDIKTIKKTLKESGSKTNMKEIRQFLGNCLDIGLEDYHLTMEDDTND